VARFHRRGRSGCLPSGSRRAKMMHARLPPKQPQHPSVKPARGQHAPALLCKTSSASEHCVSAIVDREEATSRPMFNSGGMPRSNAVRKHLTSEGVARPGRRRWPASRPGRRRRPASRSRQNRLITALRTLVACEIVADAHGGISFAALQSPIVGLLAVGLLVVSKDPRSFAKGATHTRPHTLESLCHPHSIAKPDAIRKRLV